MGIFSTGRNESHILHIATRKYISGEHMWQGASNTAVKVGTVLYIVSFPYPLG